MTTNPRMGMPNDHDPPECDYDGCTRPAVHFRWGKALCTDDYNEEYRRRQNRRRGAHP